MHLLLLRSHRDELQPVNRHFHSAFADHARRYAHPHEAMGGDFFRAWLALVSPGLLLVGNSIHADHNSPGHPLCFPRRARPVPAAIAGWLAGCLRYRSNSILPGMLTHGLGNTISDVLAMALGG